MSSPTERLQAVVQEHTALKALAASLKKQLNKAENKTKSVEAAAKKAGCTFCETAQFYGGRRCAAVDTQCELAVSDCTTFCSSGTGNDTCADCQGTSTE
eukprot:gene16316-11468_t